MTAAETPAAPPAQSPGAKPAGSQFLRGSMWNLIDYGGTQVVRLGSNLILWRLLFPEAFGLMALVNVVVQGLYMFSDVGIIPSIVQHHRGDDPDFLNTAWSIQVMRGGMLFLLAALLAVPAARFYHQPQLTPLMLMVAVTPLIQGFNSTNLATASRHLRFSRLAMVDLSAQVVGMISMVAIAYVTRSVWSLAMSGVVHSLYRLTLSHKVMPGIRNRFRWDQSAVKALAHFGRWVFLSTLLTFLAMNADRLIFGKLLTMAELGVYSIAGVWATLPATVLGRVFGAVAFPLLSRAKNLGQSIGPLFRQTRGRVLLAGAWLSTSLVAGSASLIRFLYDKRANEAIWIIPLLTAGCWFASLENTNSHAAMAVGRPKWLAGSNGAKVIAMVVFVPLGKHLGGFWGAIVGIAAADVVKYLVSAVGAIRVGVSGWRQDLLLTAGIVGISAAALALRHAVMGPHMPALLEGTLMFLFVTAAWGLWWKIERRRPAPVETAKAA